MRALDLATITCQGCAARRTLTGRQARLIRVGGKGANAHCVLCRTSFRIRVGAEHRAWARTAWDGWTQAERGAVAYAFRASRSSK
jgi:hypothetical protein